MKLKQLVTLSAAVVSVLLLASCAESVPVVNVDQQKLMLETPVIDSKNLAEAEARILKQIAAADAEFTAEKLADAASGFALRARTAQYKVAKAEADAEPLTLLPASSETALVTKSRPWARQVFAISERPENLHSERLYVFQQETPWQNYTLDSWVRLHPGKELPEFYRTEVGTTTVAADDASLLVTPETALANYLDFLSKGETSEFADQFVTDDKLKSELDSRKTIREAALLPHQGKYSLVYAPVENGTVALHTADGGAIVVGEFTIKESSEVGPQMVMEPLKVEQAFLAAPVPNMKKLVTDRAATVALYIPAKDASAAKIEAIGSEFQIVAVSAQ